MDVIRVRLREVLEQRGMTAYALARDSKGTVSLTAAYRLLRRDGHARYLDTAFLDAVCAVLKVEPGELLERVPGKTKKKRRRLATAAQ